MTSITAALSLLAWAFNLVCSDTSDQSLSRLTEGANSWFLWRRKVLIPHLPKYPGWLNRKRKVTLCSGCSESCGSCVPKVQPKLPYLILTICSCWFSCGACHQPDHDHRGAFCACQLYRVRVKRVLSTSWSFSILQPILRNAILNRRSLYHFSSIMI